MAEVSINTAMSVVFVDTSSLNISTISFSSINKVIIAADQSNGRSILTYQTNVDKIAQLTSHSMMGVSGPNCDLVSFTEYVVLASLWLLLILVTMDLCLSFRI